jgi:hypothetical protein
MIKNHIHRVILFLLGVILSSCSALVLVDSFEKESVSDGWSNHSKEYSSFDYEVNHILFKVYTSSFRAIEEQGPLFLPISPTGNTDEEVRDFRIELYMETDSQNIFFNTKGIKLVVNQSDSLLPSYLGESLFEDSTGRYDGFLHKNPFKRRYQKSIKLTYQISYAKAARLRIIFPNLYLNDSVLSIPSLKLLRQSHREYYPITCR